MGATHVAPIGTMPPDTRPPPLYPPPREVTVFAETVQAVDDTGSRDHAKVEMALLALADAVVVVGNPDVLARQRMRDLVRQLQASPPSSDLHADYVRRVLELAATIAEGGTPRIQEDTDRYRAAVGSFVAAIAAIDTRRPLLPQQPQIANALHEAVDMLHVALGLAERSAER